MPRDQILNYARVLGVFTLLIAEIEAKAGIGSLEPECVRCENPD
jgi:hypothetical protein